MLLDRRSFTQGLAATSLGVLAARADAQPTALTEGVNYVRLAQQVPVAVPGKIEVVDFFWYGCPHCADFEPALDAWSKQLPADVAFRRVPVWFREEPFSAHQRIFYALDTMGLVPTMHRKVFNAVHLDGYRLRTPDEIVAFMVKGGVDPVKFKEAYDSFSTQTRCKQARQVSEAYKIDGVPALGVNGRYFINGPMSGGNERMTMVADALIARTRKGSAA